VFRERCVDRVTPPLVLVAEAVLEAEKDEPPLAPAVVVVVVVPDEPGRLKETLEPDGVRALERRI